MIILYHLAISHYNEKARWALDIKAVPHERRAVVPGAHRFVARRIAGNTTLPALVDTDTGARLGESSAILQYLDQKFPEPRLYPADEQGRDRVLKIERYFDDIAGPAVRGFGYAYLQDFPRVLKARWSPGLSGAQRVVLALMFPVLRRLLPRVFGLTPERTERRGKQILDICTKIESWLQESGCGYLHGDTFTAADLTAVSLLGPLLQPQGSPWGMRSKAAEPGFPPAPFVEYRQEFMRREAAQWAMGIWNRHRGARA